MPLKDPKECKHENMEICRKVTDATVVTAEGVPYIKYHAPNVVVFYCPDCNTYFTYHLNAIWWTRTE